MCRVLVCCAFAGALLAIALSASSSPADETAFAVSGNWQNEPATARAHCVPCDTEPWLTFSADALFLTLDRGTRNAVPVVIAEFEAETRLTTHDLTPGNATGPRFALGMRLDSNRSVEAVYFGLHQWDSARQVAEEDNLSLPGDLGTATEDFFMADRMRLDYRTTIHNVEVNYWRRVGCTNFHFLAGFRYFNFDERFNINSRDGDTGISDYRISTRNNLYGAQFGGRWELTAGQLDLDLFGKAGIYGNAAGQRTFMADLNNTDVLRDFDTNGSRTAFVGELGLNATWKFTERLAARAGYNLMWVEGIARAPEQLDFTDTPDSGSSLVFGQGAFLHGANVGLEARW